MFWKKNKLELSPRLKSAVGRGAGQNSWLKSAAIGCLLISGILAINAIKLVYTHNQAEETQKIEQVLGISDIKNGGNNTPIEFIEYKVKKGDTLFSISQAHNIEWDTLAALNSIKAPFILKTGQIIKIPKQ